MTHNLFTTIADTSWWAPAIERLRDLHFNHGDQAQSDAMELVNRYRDDIPTMVVDVVTSRQRRYNTRVLPLLTQFKANAGESAKSLQALAQHGSKLNGLRNGEDDTIRAVAAGLVEVGHLNGATSDRSALDTWRKRTDGLEIAHNLDPYVGSVKGIGMALFCYLRLLAGSNTIKIDVRVKAALRNLGFQLPESDTATYLLAAHVSGETGIELPVLDQLLWHLPS